MIRIFFFLFYLLLTPNLKAEKTMVISVDQLSEMIDKKKQNTIFHFWATWCKPCVEELPYYFQAKKKWEGEIDIVLISLDREKKLENVDKFLDSRRFNFRSFLINNVDFDSWINKISSNWSGAIPASLFLRGESKYFFENSVESKQVLFSKIKKFLILKIKGMKKIMVVFFLIAFSLKGYATLNVSDEAVDFNLKGTDSKYYSLSSYADSKGIILVFTCNSCPFSVAYEDRLIKLHNKYVLKGFPVVAINPNDPEVQPKDSFEKMVERARNKSFPFRYLFDEDQKVYPKYGATKTPHVYVLKKENEKFIVSYIGAIDNNYQRPEDANKKYVENAVEALLLGKKPEISETKAIGCSIKKKH